MHNHQQAKHNHQVKYLFDGSIFINECLVPMSRPLTEKAPTYPSSSQRAKNWDKLEAQIKKDEKDNKEDMGDANAYVDFSGLVLVLY